MKNSNIVMGIVVILVILLVWGLIGSSEAAKTGTTCDLGINSAGSVFCWKWHKNVVGDLQDKFDDLVNN